MLTISDVINMSKNMGDFNENLSMFTKGNFEAIEKLTMGQKWKWTLVWISQMLNNYLKSSWSAQNN